jgi:hypothetical protein
MLFLTTDWANRTDFYLRIYGFNGFNELWRLQIKWAVVIIR